jgi:hypothetical protein
VGFAEFMGGYGITAVANADTGRCNMMWIFVQAMAVWKTPESCQLVEQIINLPHDHVK